MWTMVALRVILHLPCGALELPLVQAYLIYMLGVEIQAQGCLRRMPSKRVA
jgi:hypothetical protein